MVCDLLKAEIVGLRGGEASAAALVCHGCTSGNACNYCTVSVYTKTDCRSVAVQRQGSSLCCAFSESLASSCFRHRRLPRRLAFSALDVSVRLHTGIWPSRRAEHYYTGCVGSPQTRRHFRWLLAACHACARVALFRALFSG